MTLPIVHLTEVQLIGCYPQGSKVLAVLGDEFAIVWLVSS